MGKGLYGCIKGKQAQIWGESYSDGIRKEEHKNHHTDERNQPHCTGNWRAGTEQTRLKEGTKGPRSIPSVLDSFVSA